MDLRVSTGATLDIPFRYYGYYYAGKGGTIQPLTFTGESLFDEYHLDFQDFSNGFQAPSS